MDEKVIRELDAVFGKRPPRPDHLRFEPTAEYRTLCGGRILRREFDLICEVGDRNAAFPAVGFFSQTDAPSPLLICLASGGDESAWPVEDILAAGFCAIVVSLSDVSENDGNFRSRVASLFGIHRKAAKAPGKMAVWAWAVSRIIDALPAIPEADASQIFAVGDRLCARTALLAAAYDERICGVMASGAGLSVPSVSQSGNAAFFGLTERFAHLYCPRFASSLCADSMPFAGQIAFSSWMDDRIFFFDTAEFDREIPYGSELALFSEDLQAYTVGEPFDSGNVSFTVRRGGSDPSKENFIFCLNELALRLSIGKTAKKRKYF